MNIVPPQKKPAGPPEDPTAGAKITPEELEFIIPPAPVSIPPPSPPHEGVAIPQPGESPLEPHAPFPWKTIGIITASVAVLAVGGYFVYLKFSKEKKEPKQQPNIIVPEQAQNADVDIDNDGLTDAEESKRGTKQQNPDTDADGLADGDEIFVYGTDPLLFDTDNDSYPDGQEPANGYSPLQNTSGKASAEEIQTWTDNISRYGLHEPTKTTLGPKAPAGPPPKPITYTNKVYKYTFEILPSFASREKSDESQVGIYIAGNVPEDQDFDSDPINISIAFKTSSETFDQWVNEQFPASSYRPGGEVTINGIKAKIVNEIPTKSCADSKTLVPKENTVIIITLVACGSGPDKNLADLYVDIISSFRFIE